MKDGFIKVAACTPKLKVADVDYNVKEIIKLMADAEDNGARVIVFPELCITGYTCGDLFLQHTLLDKALDGLDEIIDASNGLNALIFVGVPLEVDGKLYNTAAAVYGGNVLAFIPKKNLPNYAEYYEQRHFYPGFADPVCISYKGTDVMIGQNIIFTTPAVKGLQIACEICEDLWVSDTPSTRHAMNGANLIVNLSAGNEVIGKAEYRRMLVNSTSARLVCGYVYADAGEGESTQDVVFPGHNIICENGNFLSESECFTTGAIYADIDIERIRHERRRITTFSVFNPSEVRDDNNYAKINFDIAQEETKLLRNYYKYPFVPADFNEMNNRCEHILNMQAYALKKRIEHANAKTCVIGLSGGLDSTLALIATVKAYDLMRISRSSITTVTMPCFGTTGRTYNNAKKLAESLNTTLMEIDIKDSVNSHFKDISLPDDDRSVTYENSQARERTQVLMDLANKLNGIVVGTGDMSELALGWATYNGDHMSMYGVNSGIPKTLVRHIVKYYSEQCMDHELKRALEDILDTPVSPELLPPKDGEISQKTEDYVGPYELHDFFLYYMLRCGFSPKKVYRIACEAFKDDFDYETILKWLKVFYRRFFSQQFKRSCLPDGPKVGMTALSPRGDLRMPSDSIAAVWIDELDSIELENYSALKELKL